MKGLPGTRYSVHRTRCLLLLLAMCVSSSGCSQWKDRRWMPWDKEEPQTPDKVVAVWTNTVLTSADQPATRGFGGRLMFYRQSEPKPILVEGTLVVYAFDESHRQPDDPRPDCKFVFTPEQFERHYSKSDLGHSYSVWLPWDDATGVPKKISLIVRFMPAKGSVVLGEQSTHMLPGPGQETPPPGAVEAAPAAATDSAANPVRAVGYQADVAQPIPQAAKAAPRVRTTTIDIPMQSRLCRGASGGTSLPGSMAAAQQAAPAGAARTPASTAPTPVRTGHYGVQRLRPLGQPLAAPRPLIPQQNTTPDETPSQGTSALKPGEPKA